ncbi:eCIS core domain-containing protein [Nostoc sp.]|uniref:eCIS core domain-containing protein n=1 Tax=Nostoc sp. TaxID=1180 RepID=UPI002FF75747
MREHVSQSKKATTASFSIPSLKHRIPGFGLDSSQASPQAVPLVQPLYKPLTHDISRIPLRNPQAKLSISQPGDKYEQEADSVAQQVMQRIAQPINRQSIQPEAMPEESKLQMKPLANSITPVLQRQSAPGDESELQMKSLGNSTLQRQEVPEDESELQMKPMVQRRAEARMADAPDLEASINQARGGGQVMAKNIRQPMEVAFGADFSGVKVHTDGQSDQLNRSIQARAFTTGQDVFFRQGEYNPGSRGGQELLAHELTHVVQQNGGAVQAKLEVVQRVADNIVQRVFDHNKPATYDDDGGHSYTDHGSHTTAAQHLTRLTTGITPSGRNALPPDGKSSKFASDAMHLKAMIMAITDLNANKQNRAGGWKKGYSDHYTLAGVGETYELDTGSSNLKPTTLPCNTFYVAWSNDGTGDNFKLITMYPKP